MERGDIYSVSLKQTKEAVQEEMPVLIVSLKSFNEATGTPIVLPITQQDNPVQTAGFAVRLSGEDTRIAGIVRCDLPRALRLNKENSYKLETVPVMIINEVLARLSAILE